MSLRRSRAALFRLLPIVLWRPLQWLGSLIGSIRWLVVQPARVVIAVALPVATVLSIVRDWPTLATSAIAAIWLALLIAGNSQRKGSSHRRAI